MRGRVLMMLGGLAILAGCHKPPAPRADHSAAAVAEIERLERAFSARSASVGAAKAWAEYVDADEGMLFGPTGEPAVGKDAIYEAMGGDAPSPGALTWRGDRIWAARSGDLAASWGHWTFTPDDSTKPVAHGRYVTVWRRDVAGTWKALIDIGNADAPPS